jgi:hypothetical protein
MRKEDKKGKPFLSDQMGRELPRACRVGVAAAKASPGRPRDSHELYTSRGDRDHTQRTHHARPAAAFSPGPPLDPASHSGPSDALSQRLSPSKCPFPPPPAVSSWHHFRSQARTWEEVRVPAARRSCLFGYPRPPAGPLPPTVLPLWESQRSSAGLAASTRPSLSTAWKRRWGGTRWPLSRSRGCRRV